MVNPYESPLEAYVLDDSKSELIEGLIGWLKATITACIVTAAWSVVAVVIWLFS